MWSGFGKDLRLIKKHFRRNFSRKIKTDFIFNVVGFGLISSLFLSMMLQRDLAKEGFELVSPFRYDSPGSVYYGVYSAFITTDDSDNKDDLPANNKRKSARFPDRNTIPLLVTGGSDEGKKTT